MERGLYASAVGMRLKESLRECDDLSVTG